jgi:predicted nucleic acid-binding protein
MTAKVVFVETNWVVDVLAPAHLQSPQALELLARANSGELRIFVPHISLIEAQETIPRRFASRSRSSSNELRKFVRWARDEKRLSNQDANSAFRVFDQFENLVISELNQIPNRLDNLRQHSGLCLFSLSEAMLERQVRIGATTLNLKPYDLAILAAILVKAEEIYQEQKIEQFIFCELDSDLQPWNRDGQPKHLLSTLYQKARIQVRPNFDID